MWLMGCRKRRKRRTWIRVIMRKRWRRRRQVRMILRRSIHLIICIWRRRKKIQKCSYNLVHTSIVSHRQRYPQILDSINQIRLLEFATYSTVQSLGQKVHGARKSHPSGMDVSETFETSSVSETSYRLLITLREQPKMSSLDSTSLQLGSYLLR